MSKTTKPKKSQPRQPSQRGVRKTADRKKGAVNHLATSAIASRLFSDKNFSEFERHVMEQRKSERTRALPAHEAALLEVFKLGPEVFGNKDKFISWLTHPSIALGRKAPLKLLLSRKAQLVRDELSRIEYGVYT
jgi:putative toxin-antitoxin system antitoxin component (TIGR02293 family)